MFNCQCTEYSRLQRPKTAAKCAIVKLLNIISLAIYAKLDGIPWVISTVRPTTHELVVGLGSVEVSDRRLGTRTRYVAILGLADGLRRIKHANSNQDVEETQEWLMRIINQKPTMQIWFSRLRDLAGDLLDNRGRLRTLPPHNDINTGALEVTLRYIWPEKFVQVPVPSWDEYKILLKELLSQSAVTGDLEKATVWLRAIDLLVDQSCAALFPRTDKEKVAVAELTTIKTNLDRKAEKQAKLTVRLYIYLNLAVITLLIVLIYRLTWDVMEQWFTIIGLGGVILNLLYFYLTAREFSLRTFYEQILKSKQRKIYHKFDFNIDRYKNLV